MVPCRHACRGVALGIELAMPVGRGAANVIGQLLRLGGWLDCLSQDGALFPSHSGLCELLGGDFWLFAAPVLQHTGCWPACGPSALACIEQNALI
mgnify:CR=1 FL=1